jgi:hypothetical protein
VAVCRVQPAKTWMTVLCATDGGVLGGGAEKAVTGLAEERSRPV